MTTSKRIEDVNGWYEIKDNPLSKAGVFDYLGSSIGMEPADQIFKVYRPVEELARQETIDSFKLLPWIDDHVMLGDGQTAAEEKGVEGTTGEDVYFDEKDDTLKGNIKVFSSSLIDKIEDGKRELSCGYRCKYQKKSGKYRGDAYDVIQTDLRGNHLALVENGRMGSDVAVMDEVIFTIDSKEFVRMAEEAETVEDKEADQKAADMSPEELAEKLTELAEMVGSMKKSMDAFTGGKDADEEEEAEDADPDEDDEKAEDADKDEDKDGMDQSVISGLVKDMKALNKKIDGMGQDSIKSVARRDKLVQKVTPFIGAFDHSEMTEHAVAEYAAKKIGLDCKDKISAVNAYLHDRSPVKAQYGLDSASGGGAGKGIPAINKFVKG